MSGFVFGRGVAAAGVLVALAGSAHGQSFRYWAGGVLGSWDDPSNWTTTEGTPAMGGLPQTGNTIFLREQAIIVYDGSGIADPSFTRLEVESTGSGQGSGQLLITASTLHANNFSVGDPTTDNPNVVDVSGGVLSANSAFISSGFFADNLLRVSGTGVLDVESNLIVGSSGERNGRADLVIDGGGVTARTIWISAGDYIPEDPPEPAFIPVAGFLQVNAGTLTADDVVVGESERGTLWQTGGDIDFIDYTIGNVDNEFSSRSGGIQRGGTLDVSGTIIVGAAPAGEGFLVIGDTAVTAENIRTGDGTGSDGFIQLESGSLDVTTLRLAVRNPGGPFDLDQSGGTLNAETMTLGEVDTSFDAEWNLSGGTTNVSDTLTLGLSSGGRGRLDMSGGELTARRVVLAAGTDSVGRIICDGGTVSIDTQLVVGPTGMGSVTVEGHAMFVVSETIIRETEPSSRISVVDGTFASGDLTNGAVLSSIGGVTIIGSIIDGVHTIQPTGIHSISGQAEVRARRVVNEGEILFGEGTQTLSGPLFGFPVPTLQKGTLDNQGLLRVRSSDQAEMRMNLTNSGVIDLGPGNTLNLTGDLVCQAGGQINVGINTAGTGTIEILNADAVLAGTLEVMFDDALGVPLMGTEYNIVTATATAGSATITGTFAGVSISGPANEVVYEPTRVYVRITQCGLADLTGDGLLNATDINLFVSAFLSEQSTADLNNDGLYNTTDINAFVAAFVVGCQ